MAMCSSGRIMRWCHFYSIYFNYMSANHQHAKKVPFGGCFIAMTNDCLWDSNFIVPLLKDHKPLCATINALVGVLKIQSRWFIKSLVTYIRMHISLASNVTYAYYYVECTHLYVYAYIRLLFGGKGLVVNNAWCGIKSELVLASEGLTTGFNLTTEDGPY